MMETQLIAKADLVIDQVKSMDGTDQEVIGQQQIHVQNNVMMDISLSVNNEKMET